MAKAPRCSTTGGALSCLHPFNRCCDTSSEYGILTLAAVGFAGLLGVVLSGGDVQGLLTDLVTEALNRE
ncbi:DUF4244 domain-containing protein [uncultured Micrococcus sp.]|uniref:DUF4244 domain-containing protein n=1 Tax=uncultured Micrococcus sp. TaxID=114051 RepID=UPI002596496C|nr:DUF4244 domain-containing protein [uncultured Micrococcus sp.]